MKKVFNILLIGFLAVAIVQPALGQKKKRKRGKKLSEGKIEYTMKMDGEQAAMLAMLGEMKINLAFKGDQSHMAMNMMNGMLKMDIITDNSKNETLMLMDMSMMGKRTAVKLTKEEAEKLKEAQQQETKAPEFKYFKKQTKQIAGYKCHKASVTTDQGEIVFYVTNKINVKASDLQNEFKGLEGFPLEYIISNPAMKMKITVTAENVVKGKQEKAQFAQVVPEGFTEMTLEEFTRSMGEMGNMGGTFGL